MFEKPSFRPSATGSASRASRAALVDVLEPRRLMSSSAMPVAAADVGDETPGTLAPAVFVTLPASAIAGAKVKGASALVSITNVAPDDYNGPVTVTLFASLDNTLQAGTDAQITTITKNLKVASAESANLKIKIPSLPAVADGAYLVIAQLTSSTAGNGVSASDETLTIAGPFVDLSGTFTGLPTSAVKGKRAKATVSVANAGNTNAKGTIPITIATTPNVDGSGATTFATVNAKVSLKPGSSKALKLNFTVPPEMASGTYYIVATLDATNVLGDKDVTNNTVLSSVTVTIP